MVDRGEWRGPVWIGSLMSTQISGNPQNLLLWRCKIYLFDKKHVWISYQLLLAFCNLNVWHFSAGTPSESGGSPSPARRLQVSKLHIFWKCWDEWYMLFKLSNFHIFLEILWRVMNVFQILKFAQITFDNWEQLTL